MTRTPITQATGGDTTHQHVALHYFKQGSTPVEAMASLKASKYLAKLGDITYHLSASSVASILTGMYLVTHQVTTGKATCTKSKGLTFKAIA